MRKMTVLMVMLMMLCGAGTAFGQIIVGWPMGGGTTNGPGVVSHTTIAAAIVAAGPGGTVNIDGTYNPAAAGEVFPVCLTLPGQTFQGYLGVQTLVLGNGSDKIFAVTANQITIQNLVFVTAGPGDSPCGTPQGRAGAIYISGNNVLVQWCEFYANVTFAGWQDGAAIYVDSTTTVTITNSIFADNIAVHSGGAIFVNASSDVIISLNEIQHNSANGLDGGGIAWWNESDGLILQNTIFTNQAPYGGGITIVGCNTAPTLVDHNTITSNTAYGTAPCVNGGMGGGIYIESSNQTVQVLNHNEVSSNTADYFGGGIATAAWTGVSCSPQILNNEIRYNEVRYNCGNMANGGGGISVLEDASNYVVHPLIRGNLIAENEAGLGVGAVYGGGIGIFYAAAQIELNIIEGNQVDDLGGGIAAYSSYMPLMGPQLTMEDNIVRNNIARSYGGGVELDGCGTVILDRNNIDQNTGTHFLTSYGGGLDSYWTLTTARSNNFTRNWTTTGNGTAVWLDNGSLDFYNNTVADNDFGAGSQAIALGATADLENNIIADHPNLDAVAEIGGDQTVICINNLFWNNANVYYDGALGYRTVGELNAIPGNSGNIAGDPLLDGTYHLSTPTSPAYDGGVDLTGQGVTFDIDNEARPYHTLFDIGSDELYQNPTAVDDWLLY